MPAARSDENSAALSADLRASALFDVRGKVVVVSGGGSGIGAMLAAGFVRNGASVYVFSRKDTAEYAAALTARGPGRCTAFRANLQQLETLQPLISEIEAREGRVDVLVNNAGTNHNEPFATQPAKAFAKVVDVNLNSVFAATQLFAPLLRAAPPPARVINIASVNGIDPPVNMDTFAYSSSKAAVMMLSRHLAAKLAPDVTVNSLCPGPFHSRMMRGTFAAAGEETIADGTLVGRVGRPADIVGAALLLASDAGSFLTGVALPVDGGTLLCKL